MSKLFHQTKKTVLLFLIPIMFTVFLFSCGDKKEDVQPQPTVASLSISEGVVGTNVTITGTNFGTLAADVEVTFNNTKAVVTNVTATAIATTVPTGATSGSVKVKVKLLQASGPSFTVLAPITVSASAFTATIAENLSPGAVIGTVSASTNRGSLSYSLVSQSPAGAMAINSSTGQLTVALAGVYDFELTPTVTGVVSVANGNETATANVTLTITNVIEVNLSNFTGSIPENSIAGTVIGQMTSESSGGTSVFSLNNQSVAGALAINSATAQITVANASAFNFETTPTITAQATVTNRSEVKTASVTITVTDVAEPTVTVSNFTASIAENAAAASVLGTLTATATLGTATFSISSQTPAGAIAVNATTGQLTVADESKFNFELFPTITANVLATNSSATATAIVTITLTDVTETVQKRLDDGETPLQIYNSDNSLLNQIYGKTYRGGLIATFNTANGTGVIMTAAAIAGGPFTYTNAVSAANNLVLNTFEDWRLPTETEVNSICGILASVPNLWQPTLVPYWGQTTCCGGGGANNYSFANGGCSGGFSPISQLSEARAVRNY
ncbi:MAG: IPT/TIG domain-containing protein [Cytophagales bacterium]|jgi:hypothetical protein|nr:IPT/TIG domain-containing protein [Rhodocyclaceae bacterium]MCA6380824.1 IPT/TIG domain-containing protein [Cytophagales bacterium]MCA6388153.1 IPT/TIG domain-containing protein [Cytophagales bacterium]MCA6391680.1 IPT/TIG domain-containing protein [Cytophagales bacterium]MCA6397116.1 IPT/TIG domain-containing protein [Cytophagales bacterium]